MNEILEKKIGEFIDKQEKKTGVSDIKENLESVGLQIKVFERLKNEQEMMDYANLFLKEKFKGEKRTLKEEFKFLKLEVKLRIKCSYFEDFKVFLEELEKGENTNSVNEHVSQESVDNSENLSIQEKFLGISLMSIKSSPFYRNPGSGVTRCSRTARYNGENFGLDIPSGNAYDAGKEPGTDSLKTIPNDKIKKKPNSRRSHLKSELFPSSDNINFADIYTTSNSKYGHRAVAFKDDGGQWYVLDPYVRVNGIMNNDPKKLEDYAKVRPILKAHFYQSTRYEFKNQSYT